MALTVFVLAFASLVWLAYWIERQAAKAWLCRRCLSELVNERAMCPECGWSAR